MRAIGIQRFGGPEELVEVDLPTPEPGAGEVRVRVHAAAVNPTDITFRSGGRAAQLEGRRFPLVPGVDLAGTIDAVGPEVESRLQVGDRVIGLVNPFGAHGGSYAEQVVVDARSVVAAPAGADLFAASTLLLNALTANLALDAIAAPPGGAIAVTGSLGAVGGYVLQLAALRGLEVIADAADGDAAIVATLGATTTVPRGDAFAAAVRVVRPDGVAGVVDAAGLVDAAVPAVMDGGVVVELKGQVPASARDVRLAPISSFSAFTDLALLSRLSELATDGALPLRVAEVLPATDAAEAHRRLALGGLRGRLVLDLTTFR
ncbi:MAG: NADP-dependent oxidoreductase [Acidobacteria bacterium]|nr:NADP-dependent oxidoreductase [Acidobacteriota bacterium]